MGNAKDKSYKPTVISESFYYEYSSFHYINHNNTCCVDSLTCGPQNRKNFFDANFARIATSNRV